MENETVKKKVHSKKSIIGRLIFIIAYSIFLYLLSIFLINLGIEHFIIIIIIIFLILIVLGPLITGITKDFYYRLFGRKREKKEQSDYQAYKELLKTPSQDIEKEPIDTSNISLDFKYRKPIIRKCSYCGIVIPNFVKKCPNCGNPVLD